MFFCLSIESNIIIKGPSGAVGGWGRPLSFRGSLIIWAVVIGVYKFKFQQRNDSEKRVVGRNKEKRNIIEYRSFPRKFKVGSYCFVNDSFRFNYPAVENKHDNK